MDASLVKKDFPIFDRKINNNKLLVYLDSAATSQKPRMVIDAMGQFYKNSNANIHRGIHELAEEATFLFEEARSKISAFIGSSDPQQLLFTRNTTESINLVANTWGSTHLHAGDLIILTEMEHHSNLVPWFMAKERQGFQIEFLKVDDSGLLDMEHYEKLLRMHPKLVSFTHMSNVLGTINPVLEMTAMAHQRGALVLIDGAQSVPHFAVNVSEIDADFYAFSAHKMCGPTGIGALYGKKAILEEMPPYLGGGDMIKKVTFEGFVANELPYKFEAGTPAIAEAIGFGAAVDYLNAIGMDEIAKHEKELTRYAMETIAVLENVHIIGPQIDHRGGVISFYVDGIHPHDVAQILDLEGIAVRAGHHCAMPLHQRFNIPATTRASSYIYNTKEDFDRLKSGLLRVQEIFDSVKNG